MSLCVLYILYKNNVQILQVVTVKFKRVNSLVTVCDIFKHLQDASYKGIYNNMQCQPRQKTNKCEKRKHDKDIKYPVPRQVNNSNC